MPTIIDPNALEYIRDASALEQFELQTLVPRLSIMADSKHLVFDLRRLDPGKYSFPYHFHRYAEELIMIFSGSLTIRTIKGFEIVQNGQIVFFEMGETGVHQFYNHEAFTCTYLDIKTNIGLDVCEYPDSGKIYLSPNNEIFEKQSQVDYNKGEENVQSIWDSLRNE